MTTNIIRGKLLEYTKDQCELVGVELTPSLPSGLIWSPKTRRWKQEYVARPLTHDYPVLLVPKRYVKWAKRQLDAQALTEAYTRLGEALGLDWAQQQVARFEPSDQWERLLVAGLERDFEQLRLEFLARGRDGDPLATTDRWIERQAPRIAQFRKLIAQGRLAGAVTASMLAQIASQARILLAR